MVVPMRLIISPTSPYSRKARVLLREKGLEAIVTEVITNVYESNLVTKYNPLGRVPVLKDQSLNIYDSIIICQYLNNYQPDIKKSIYSLSNSTWEDQIRVALADGIIDSALQLVIESRRPIEYQSSMIIERHTAHILRGLQACEEQISEYKIKFDIPEIGLACALSYLNFRLPNINWGSKYHELYEWFEKVKQYKSMKETEFTIL
ncbi:MULTISPECIES: glutathione S-transferase N-terminal domain-containing protein [Acinetobacter]|nr:MULTISPECIES: glutathione S-transferase N-terminal domain-containing protein [Acinetobacter]MCJ0830559.1 glutathione S-transferase N-terminal domain-containing protein [Acinetobacter sp. NIPH1876]USI86034.1 glutathione S-transferase N-terminal domain-containing protein [Acinetobacter johnsonii]WLF72244.1 glutathione S-transferase N-terminal domain-containing protein [Acinetobacter junii]